MSYNRACCCRSRSMYASGINSALNDESVWKFSHTGNELARYDAAIDMAWVAVAPDGSVAVGGPRATTGPGTGGNPYFLWKLNSDLEFQWGFDRGPLTLRVLQIEIDADGSLYVAGSSRISNDGFWKLDDAGNIVWSAIGYAQSIDLDATYVYASVTVLEQPLPKLRKYRKSNGALIWSVDTGAAGAASRRGVRVASDGSVFNGVQDTKVEKRSGTDGSLIASYVTTNNLLTGGLRSIDIDAGDNVYLAGGTSTTWAGNDGTERNIWKLDLDLNLLDSAYSGAVRENSIQVDDSDGSIWTGGTKGPGDGIRRWSSDLIETASFGPEIEVLCATYGYRNIPT